MKAIFFSLFLICYFDNLQAREIFQNSFPKDTVPVLQRIYVKLGLGLSDFRTIHNDYLYDVNVGNTPMYYFAAGINLNGFWRGVVNRMEIGYAYASSIEGDGKIFQRIGSYGPTIYIEGSQYYRSVMGSLRFSWLPLFHLPLSHSKERYFYAGAGITYSNIIHYKSYWTIIYPDENTTRTGPKTIEPMIISFPLVAGIWLNSRLCLDLQYLKDKIEENDTRQSRRTLTLSCSYTLR